MAKRIAEVRVNHHSVGDPFLSDAFLGVDTAALVPAEARLRRNVPECVWHLPSGATEASTHIMVHRHGHAPVTVPCPSMLPPSEIVRLLCSEGIIPANTRLQLPWACPHLPGVGPHFNVPDGEADAQVSLVIVDVRRIVTPPSVLYWTTAVLTLPTLAEAQALISSEFPSAAPVLQVYVEDTLLEHSATIGRNALVTVMGFPDRFPAGVTQIEPALRLNQRFIECPSASGLPVIPPQPRPGMAARCHLHPPLLHVCRLGMPGSRCAKPRPFYVTLRATGQVLGLLLFPAPAIVHTFWRACMTAMRSQVMPPALLPATSFPDFFARTVWLAGPCNLQVIFEQVGLPYPIGFGAAVNGAAWGGERKELSMGMSFRSEDMLPL